MSLIHVKLCGNRINYGYAFKEGWINFFQGSLYGKILKKKGLKHDEIYRIGTRNGE